MELEKLAKELLKGGNAIGTVHFNDIHDNQNVYLQGVDKESTKREEPEQTANANIAEPAEATTRDKLSAYIKPENYKEVVDLAGLCEKPADITRFVCAYIQEHKLMKEIDLSSKDFIEALKPHLKNFKGSMNYDNLRKVMNFPI